MPVKKPRAGRGVRKAGRPSLFTEARISRVIEAVRGGAPRHHAAAFAGIGRSTLQEWLARGHSGEQPYAEFLERVEEAEGTRVVGAVVKINTSPHWQAQAWLLERWAKEFRRPPEQVELSNPDGTLQPIGLTLQHDAEAVRLIRALRDRGLPPGPAR